MIIEVVNGPNLNLLGKRETALYGAMSLEEINREVKELSLQLGVEQLIFFQSNSEGGLVDEIQSLAGKADGLLINPGAYGHTSIAMRDAILAVKVPFVEVHLTNIHAREDFRRKTFLSDIAVGVVVGFGADSYLLGLRGLCQWLSARSSG
ncbi:MAG: type II 3-dehydroquinate dehydratase [Cyanobacteria bacterium]|nr:type II 3-dehydroquinate dehydratase [Cyanobacteriota bacterium]